jgi:hypothetical protein
VISLKTFSKVFRNFKALLESMKQLKQLQLLGLCGCVVKASKDFWLQLATKKVGV